MAQDHIRYDILAQDALRGVMRKVLTEVAKTGLPGNHHFFIAFLTQAPGVRISSRLMEKYPEQMTIVLQYQYWDLKVAESGFEVGLSFSDIPEKLEVPFSAVRGFYDPSVNFELEFDVRLEENQVAEITELQTAPAQEDVPDETAPPPKQSKAKGKAARPQKEIAKDAEDAEKPAADIVSLDAFRKKK